MDAVVAGKTRGMAQRRGDTGFHACVTATGNAQSLSEDQHVAGTMTSVLEASMYCGQSFLFNQYPEDADSCSSMAGVTGHYLR